MESDIKKELKWCMQKEEQVSFLAEKIRQADAVLIGGGSGLSSAAGYNHYHWFPIWRNVYKISRSGMD